MIEYNVGDICIGDMSPYWVAPVEILGIHSNVDEEGVPRLHHPNPKSKPYTVKFLENAHRFKRGDIINLGEGVAYTLSMPRSLENE